MKLILDEGMPLRATAALRELGVDAKHILEMRLGGASDQVVLNTAGNEEAAVVTLDADFHQILATTGAGGPSVIRLRTEGLSAQKLAELLNEALTRFGQELQAGAMVTIAGGRIRLRKLPIRG